MKNEIPKEYTRIRHEMNQEHHKTITTITIITTSTSTKYTLYLTTFHPQLALTDSGIVDNSPNINGIK
jgi:hypothetical protein